MDLSDPLSTVVPTTRGSVLSVLVRSGPPLTGRAIASLTEPRVSQSQASTILRQLVSSGLATMLVAGRAHLYAINRSHLAYPPVADLVMLRERLWERMRDHAAGWNYPPDALVVYGSTARGDSHETSDIDILVVRPPSVVADDNRWHHDLDDFSSAVNAWTGNGVELLDQSATDLADLARNGERLLRDIRSQGRFLIGDRRTIPTPTEKP